jgi:MFS transporter, PHS family, inorganic phosphate transporter
VKIVDDGGFKGIIFLVVSSGFLATSYSLFATDVLTPSLYYVYPPCGRLDNNSGEVIDQVTFVGMILGMLVMGHLADLSGRKKWYGIELSLLIVATMGLIQASEGFMVLNADGSTSHSMDIYSWLAWWRFLIGFGIGAEVRIPLVNDRKLC